MALKFHEEEYAPFYDMEVPMTAPVVKATLSPSFNVPRVHATVVRELPSVATLIPNQPAAALRTAPETKARTTRNPSTTPPNPAKVSPRRPPSAATNTARYLYSSCKKAFAPDFTCAASLSIFGCPMSFPVGFAMTTSRRQNAKQTLKRPATRPGTTSNIKLTSSGAAGAAVG